MLIIEVANLKKVYRGTQTVEALKGITFNVDAGEIFGILGPNGAGKTTTLSILECLKKPTSGDVKVAGFDIKKDKKQIKKNIGVQLQSSQYPPLLTLKELLELFASIYASKINPRETLGFVNLEDKANEVVKNLSGGQKQRFTIATSLVGNPKILFLDEPTTGLDPKARRELWALIKQINAKGITILLTTHYMEEAEYLCDRVAIIDKGEILTIDAPKKLISKLSHTTQISFFTDDKLADDFWKNISAVEKVYSNYPKIILEINTLDSISQVLSALRDKGVNFTGFTVKTATLEDVYLDLTGREFNTDS